MDLRFILTLTEHRVLGYVYAPYFVVKERREESLTIYDRVTSQNIDTYKNVLNPEQAQLVKYIEEYNDRSIYRVFCKDQKKIKSHAFMAKIDEDLLLNHIRPYVEKRMARCLDVLKFNPVPVYQKILQNSIYESDLLQIVEEEGNTLFNFTRTDSGLQYYLSIEHKEKELKLMDSGGIVVTNEPCSLILNDNLFIFRDIDGKKILPFLDKECVNIPKTAEQKYFESFVRNAIRNNKVKATGFEINDLKDEPKPILSVESDLSGRIVLILRFAYEKALYHANEKTSNKVTCTYREDKVVFNKLERNLSIENEYITKLLSLGLKNESGPYFLPFIKKDDSELQGYQLINWINFNKKAIEKAGFSLAQDKLDNKFYLEKFELKFEVGEKDNDWFDINAFVAFDEEKIPFIRFRNHILNGEREFQLPNGRIVVLPEEWFETYRDILTFAKKDDDGLRLDKQHFALLNKKSVGSSLDIKEKLTQLYGNENDVQVEIPAEVNAKLRPYQSEGYSWMYNMYQHSFGGCLADDMGLGKTLQTLTLLRKVINDEALNTPKPEENKKTGNTQPQLSLFDAAPSKSGSNGSSKASIIIVPTSLVHNWVNEVQKFVPDVKISTYVGASRGTLQEHYDQSDLIISSYGILRNDLAQFQKLQFLYLVLDESQMIKNPGSKTYQAVISLQSDYRLVLTGTPIENALSDLWAQMNFINPGLLGNINFFRNEFILPIEKHSDESRQKKLKQLIAPFILRRTKQEVAKDLPPVTEQNVFCNLSEPQEVVYEREKSKARNLVMENIGKFGMNKAAIMILQSLTRLRQIANHPVLADEEYLAGSGKYDEVTRVLRNLKAEGHKALIFSSFVKHLDLVAGYLDKESINYSYLTGATQKRELEIDKFQQNDDCPFFLISLKAGGVGLNLTAADYVLILDPWWNPAAESQAISRAHRIGQEKHVMVYRFITRNTLEEKILKLQQKKADLADMFINENSIKNIAEEEIMELFE